MSDEEFIHRSPPRVITGNYFTVGSAGPSESPNFTTRTKDGETYATVFLSQQSANKYRKDNSIEHNVLVSGWKSINQLALQVQKGGTNIPFILLENPPGCETAFEMKRLSDFLE